VCKLLYIIIILSGLAKCNLFLVDLLLYFLYNKGMSYILIGILIGWLTPRPKYLAPIEEAIWKPIKEKLPEDIRKLFG
tara:strand:+ start:4197 stop:4430 length:234 start_codon:yes stop_codon:yes gene_type:complete